PRSGPRQALFELGPDRLADLRHPPCQIAEVRAEDDRQAHRRPRRDRGGAPVGREQADLAEPLARPEVDDVLPVDLDRRRPVLDQEELVGDVALAAEHAALLDVDLVDELRDLLDLALREAGEEVERADAARVHVRAILSAEADRHNAAVSLSPSVDNLVAQLTRLPGVGTRTAQRLAFHLLQRPKDEALALAHAIEDVKE